MDPQLVLVAGLIGDLIAVIEEFVLDLTTDTYNAVGWFGVVVMMAIENVIVPLPSEIVMPLAGWKLVLEPGHGPWHLVLAGLFGALGSLIGSLITYWIGAAGGRPLLERYGRYVLITRRDLARADHWFATRGELTVFVTRLIPVVRGFISLPAGVSRMNIWRFSAYTFAGAFPWSLGLAWGGYLLGDNWESLRSTLRPFDIPVILVVLAAAAWYVWHKRKELRRDAEETRNLE
ncbi:MAG: DedA family protein [Chloroflexi bacterium]|nr:DedA family protein [Chloroflexota bacterium]